MQSSFLKKLSSKGTLPIFFITCSDDEGRDCFYYLISTPEKMQMYKKVRTGKFDLNDYGKIIACGYGLQPDEQTQQMLQEKYGV